MAEEVLLIEGCDFESSPRGGQLTFAQNLLSAFGNRFALVGLSSDGGPVGRWTTKRIGGVPYSFFAIGRVAGGPEKPFIPARLSVCAQLQRWRRAIQSRGGQHALVMAPEVLIAVHRWRWRSICFNFAGVNNPLVQPRYRWASLLAQLFDAQLFRALQDAEVLLAAADDKAISALVARSRGALRRDRILQFPTFVDTATFRPAPPRSRVGTSAGPVVVCTGRLSRAKGWDLVLDAFSSLVARHAPDATLVFVGDGEDRPLVESHIARLGLAAKVTITGFKDRATVAAFVSGADVVVLGSHEEGWPTAIVEALACGKPVVSTDVSAARTLVMEAQNGFVVSGRDPDAFADAIDRARHLERARDVSLELAQKYSLESMASMLRSVWPPLR